MPMGNDIQQLIELNDWLKKELDLTCEAQLSQIIKMADQVLAWDRDLFDLRQLERNPRYFSHLGFQLALKLAISKHCVNAINAPTEITVVFAVYGETKRMMNAQQHKYGEDCVRRKVEQLDWLVADNPHTYWRIEIVDDGCPEGSGALASNLIRELGRQDQISVHYLEHGISTDHPACTALTQCADSQKGGAIAYGLWLAQQRNSSAQHYICYTDADLSTHLGQLGLLLEPLIQRRANVSCGSRREAHSIVLKGGTRNQRGKLFIYLWQQLLPHLAYMLDTQCGFKAFRADTLEPLLRDRVENRFAFDLELLLKAELNAPNCLAKVAIGWIDSEQLSSTTQQPPYLSMLKSAVIIYHNYLPLNAHANAYAKLISMMDEAAWERMLSALVPILETQSLEEVLASSELSAQQLLQAAYPDDLMHSPMAFITQLTQGGR